MSAVVKPEVFDILKKVNTKTTSPILLTPGPAQACPFVLKTLAEPFLHHRSQSFEQELKIASLRLQKIFYTKQPVLILNASGTGAMEAGLLNTLSPGDHVLVLSAGRFGERWIEMAKNLGLKVTEICSPWGNTINIKEAELALKNSPDIKAVLAQACETSTGVLHPVKELAHICQKNNVLCILDAVSALGAVVLPMDKWGIDVMIGGSQKCFGLPAGLAFIALSEKAWQAVEQSRLPKFYFNLKKERQAQLKGQTSFSSNTSFIKALNQALQPIDEKGASYFIQKSEKQSRITRDFCKILGLKMYAKTPSPSVTSFTLPQHIKADEIKKYMESKHNVMLAGGQGQLKGKILRIGHLGGISLNHLSLGLKALALSLHSKDPSFISNAQLKVTLDYLQKISA